MELAARKKKGKYRSIMGNYFYPAFCCGNFGYLVQRCKNIRNIGIWKIVINASEEKKSAIFGRKNIHCHPQRQFRLRRGHCTRKVMEEKFYLSKKL